MKEVLLKLLQNYSDYVRIIIQKHSFNYSFVGFGYFSWSVRFSSSVNNFFEISIVASYFSGELILTNASKIISNERISGLTPFAVNICVISIILL